ncbi:MAG: hypothetical protein ABSA82_06945 [Thermacetogeniaceae bacterium]|jgi:hypothetical protein
MNIILRVLKEVFNFFCGDWRVFWGVTITTVLVELIERLTVLAYAKSFAGIIFIAGISLSLVVALKREIAG